MRKISVIAVKTMLLVSMGISANGSDPKSNLSVQIGELLKQTPFVVQQGDLTADVRFTFNADGELVVLSVSAQEEKLVGFVKSRLNYQKMNVADYQEGKLYTVRVRITS